MAEAIETQTTEQPAPVVEDSKPTPTLEDVYKEFIPAASSPPAASPPHQPQVVQPPPAPPALEIPDPNVEPEKFKMFLADRARAESALLSSYQQLSGAYTQIQREKAMEKLSKDISSAVEVVNANLAEPLPDAQKKLIEFALEDKARNDPRFKQLWDNRSQNPIAWSRALAAVSSEVGSIFDRKVDPQLRADRQALKISQSQSATTKTETEDGPAWSKLPADSQEFQQAWQRAARGYQ